MSIPYEVRKRLQGVPLGRRCREANNDKNIGSWDLLCPRLGRDLFGPQTPTDTFTISFLLFHSQPQVQLRHLSHMFHKFNVGSPGFNLPN